MTLVTLLSTIAMLLGLGGILPQLVRMVRSRSAGGQAPLGWGMGCAAHASMAYVNFFGFDSLLLSASNLVAGTLCAIAIVLITTLRGSTPAAPIVVDELPTQEFVALRAAVLAREPRTRRSRQARRASYVTSTAIGSAACSPARTPSGGRATASSA
jgi:hypothetical protein